MDAADLSVGTELSTVTGKPVILLSNEVVQTPTVAYNLEVDEFHTYVVGDNQVWVHNSCDVPKYAPADKHRKGGWGTEMDLDDDIAQDVLNQSIQGGKQKYGYRDGKLYEF